VLTDRQAAQRASVLAQLKRMQEQQATLLARQQILRQQMLANKIQQLKARSAWNAGLPSSSWAPPVERCNPYTDIGAHVDYDHVYPQRIDPGPAIEQSPFNSPQTTESGAQYFEYGGAHYFTDH